MIQVIRRTGRFQLVALLIAVVLSCPRANSQPNTSEAQATPKQVTVGAVLPLTGSYAEYGQNVLAALQVAAAELNRDTALQIHLVAKDDQGDPGKAVAALQELISTDSAKFVIGGFTSSCSEAMYPLAERSGVLMFSSSTSTPNLTKDTPLFFRNWPSDREQAPVFADQTFNRFGRRTAALLYSRSEYGVDVEALFREAYEGIGGKVVIAEAYKPKSKDFKTQIQRFLDQPADCIWLFGYYSEIGHFLKQARDLGLRTQFFGQEGIEATGLLDIAGDAAEGLIYLVPAFDASAAAPNVERFVTAFTVQTGRTPDVVAAHAYDALQILADAIEAVGPESQRVAQYLLKVKDYPGVAGTTTFDQNGEVKRKVIAKTIQKAKFVPCKASTDQPAAPQP